MSKIKLILAVLGVLTLGPAMSAYAMMGGGYGNGSNNHMTQGGDYRTTHMDSYGPGYYYSPDNHMSTDEMDAAHYGRYQHDSNRAGNRQYRQDNRNYHQNGQRGSYGHEQGQHRSYYYGR